MTSVSEQTATWQLPDGELAAEIVASQARMCAEYARQLDLVAEADQRGLASVTGYRTTDQMLTGVLHISQREAKARVAEGQSSAHNKDCDGDRLSHRGPFVRVAAVRDNDAMSFDLAVLALATDDSRTARQQFERCLDGSTHAEGEPDERIVAFYKQLQAIHPDHDAAVYENDCPWSSAPLDVGIDHVIMNMSFGSHST